VYRQDNNFLHDHPPTNFHAIVNLSSHPIAHPLKGSHPLCVRAHARRVEILDLLRSCHGLLVRKTQRHEWKEELTALTAADIKDRHGCLCRIVSGTKSVDEVTLRH